MFHLLTSDYLSAAQQGACALSRFTPLVADDSRCLSQAERCFERAMASVDAAYHAPSVTSSFAKVTGRFSIDISCRAETLQHATQPARGTRSRLARVPQEAPSIL